jgi:acyl-CoA thioesterase-1
MARRRILKILLAGWALLAVLISVRATDGSDSGSTNRTIVVLGDSLAAGYGVDPSESWPTKLQEKISQARLPYTVINAGVSGDTTAGGLRRLSWVLKRKIDLLVLELGGNDGLRGIPVETTKSNLLGIIAKTKERWPEVQIVIAGMQMPGNMGEDYRAKFQEVFAQVAKETRSTLIPFLLDGVGGHADLNQADQIHPNPAGHALVAEHVWTTLRPLLSR